MRAILLFFVAVCFCVIACEPGPKVTPGLFGKWEARRLYGGIAGFDSTYNPGNGRVLQLNTDRTYLQFTGGKITKQGTYRLTSDDVKTDESTSIFFDSSDYQQPIVLAGTKLTIGTTITDQIAVDYVKIGN